LGPGYRDETDRTVVTIQPVRVLLARVHVAANWNDHPFRRDTMLIVVIAQLETPKTIRPRASSGKCSAENKAASRRHESRLRTSSLASLLPSEDNSRHRGCWSKAGSNPLRHCGQSSKSGYPTEWQPRR
jgi:hypothetical protein